MATTTYDSGGAGSLPDGGNPDYSALATWEAATDIALSAIEYLDCYDSQNHNDTCQLDGATGLSATVYRVIQSASDCAVPFAGVITTGAYFSSTADAPTLKASENYVQFRQLSTTMTINSVSGRAAIALSSDYAKAIHCICYNSQNAGTGTGAGFFMGQTGNLCYGCISYDNEVHGFRSNCSGTDLSASVCCISINNGTHQEIFNDVTEGQWHHSIMTYTGGIMRLYLDMILSVSLCWSLGRTLH